MRKMIQSILLAVVLIITGCGQADKDATGKSAEEIIGNPDYRAICFGGYREITRDIVPSVDDLKEDMLILDALGIKLLRTYNTQDFDETVHLLEAIHQLKQEDPEFEMYLMMGAWIKCKNARTDSLDHARGDTVFNTAEIEMAVKLANKYPDIVKSIAVGNEAMVHWQAGYYVLPHVILNWVNYLQDLKAEGKLPGDLWITSSDNFASWGGGDDSYHLEDLNELIKAVDFLSVHTYPFHDSHYNPDYWLVPSSEQDLEPMEQIDAAMLRARDYAMSQVDAVKAYMESLGVDKPIAIGETGWATISNELYGAEGSKAADEYKSAIFHDHIRKWTDDEGISCFYFEAFDEKWKDAGNPGGSENHFGLINLDNEAKFVLWDVVDEGVFEGLSRGGKPIVKSYGGNLDSLMNDVLVPPFAQ